MFGNLLKTMKRTITKGGFCIGIGEKTMMFIHKAIFDLSYCNIMIFIIYMPALQDISI
jgi:hypothetical protein